MDEIQHRNSLNISLIVFDLDGTLLDSRKQVSARNQEAIRKCHASGIKIVYATARPPRAVAELLPTSLRQIGSMVFYNGALIRCIHTGIEAHETIPPALASAILDEVYQHHPDADMSLEVDDIWFSHKPYDAETLMNVKGAPVVVPLEEMKRLAATKILLSGNSAAGERFRKFEHEVNIVVTDRGTLAQISSKNASKESAVAKLCEAMGISMQEVMAFGDDANDIGLFRACGWPVAMGNAIDELKASAKVIADTNDRDGVAKVLERILSNES
ncbi:HAD family hydrolase [Paenibacillaceae bacterium WGS1546]|uniref:HAD family hydrolase n=1 Tax=Cohnella sp. WGS1546 TaxID=3366810 RepID=UPI00372D4E24